MMRMQFGVRFLLSAIASSALTACTSPAPTRNLMDGIPEISNTENQIITEESSNPGSIYRTTGRFSLFEDKPSARVGDQVIVSISEKTNATKSSKSSASRDSNISTQLPKISNLPGGLASLLGIGIGVDAKSTNKHTGGGDTAQNNNFSGTITTTVQKILPNGNLVIKGKKQIALNGDLETLTLEGVVNPQFINQASTVSSLNVGEARIGYDSKGAISNAQNLGFMNRLFMSVAPI